jgi:hypothetical protein
VIVRLARARPDLRITAVDGSSPTFELARRVVRKAEFEARVTAMLGYIPGLARPGRSLTRSSRRTCCTTCPTFWHHGARRGAMPRQRGEARAAEPKCLVPADTLGQSHAWWPGSSHPAWRPPQGLGRPSAGRGLSLSALICATIPGGSAFRSGNGRCGRDKHLAAARQFGPCRLRSGRSQH